MDMNAQAKGQWKVRAVVRGQDGTVVDLGVISGSKWRRAVNLPLQWKLYKLRRRQAKWIAAQNSSTSKLT